MPTVSVQVSELDPEFSQIPDAPAVFLVWAASGAPYLAKTTLLRRRLRRLLKQTDRLSRVLRLNGVAERIEYQRVGSQLEAQILFLEFAQRHFPQDWPKITRVKPPALLRLTTANEFPRTMITTRLGRGLFVGPFASRAAAERYQGSVLDLFQVRRCEENLAPTPEHPGCIYGEMNKCLRPCQAVVSREEYASEVTRFEEFLRTGGASLVNSAEAARDRASAEMQFEDAERWHQRVEKIREASSTAGDLARPLSQLAGVAVTASPAERAVELLFLIGGAWLAPRRLMLADTVEAGQSLDRRLREMVAQVTPADAPNTSPNLEHLAIFARWYNSSWRDGEWIGFDSMDRIPYRRIVNAVARVVGVQAGLQSGVPQPDASAPSTAQTTTALPGDQPS